MFAGSPAAELGAPEKRAQHSSPSELGKQLNVPVNCVSHAATIIRDSPFANPAYLAQHNINRAGGCQRL